MSNDIILRHHQLRHLPELRVNDSIFKNNFAPGCSMANCNATCCKGGVWIDISERDNILSHAPRIQHHMDAQQEHRPELWFEDQETPDADFPSGRAVGTRTNENGCVFLKPDGKCVLQTTAVASGMDKFALKPFFCVAFPVTVEYGELMIDDLEFGYRSECCSVVTNGSQSVFDVCGEELGFVLGEEGFRELRAHHNKGVG